MVQSLRVTHALRGILVAHAIHAMRALQGMHCMYGSALLRETAGHLASVLAVDTAAPASGTGYW
jgi:hypothetical protein